MEKVKDVSKMNVALLVLIFLIAGLGFVALLFNFSVITSIENGYTEYYSGYNVIFNPVESEKFQFAYAEYGQKTLQVLFGRISTLSIIYLALTALMVIYLAISAFSNRNDLDAFLKSALPKLICVISFLLVLFCFLYGWSFSESATHEVWKDIQTINRKETLVPLVTAKTQFYIPLIIDAVMVIAFFILVTRKTKKEDI